MGKFFFIASTYLLEADRAAFYTNSEQIKRELQEEADLLRKENKDLKKLRDDLQANKRVTTTKLYKLFKFCRLQLQACRKLQQAFLLMR